MIRKELTGLGLTLPVMHDSHNLSLYFTKNTVYMNLQGVAEKTRRTVSVWGPIFFAKHPLVDRNSEHTFCYGWESSWKDVWLSSSSFETGVHSVPYISLSGNMICGYELHLFCTWPTTIHMSYGTMGSINKNYLSRLAFAFPILVQPYYSYDWHFLNIKIRLRNTRLWKRQFLLALEST